MDIGVSIKPGATVFAKMFLSAYSKVIDLAIDPSGIVQNS